MSLKEFDDIKISTTTAIVATNMEINLSWLYDILPIFTVHIPHHIKKTKDFQQYIINMNPPFGSITMVKHKDKFKGVKVKKNKKKAFRNALSMVIFVGKLITVKIPTKGKLQMTGCTNDEHSELCVKYLWKLLSGYSSSEDTYRLIDKTHLHCIFLTVMTNIVFELGFKIDKMNLDTYMNMCTNFNSLLDTSIGYTGVNIKIPFKMNHDEMRIKTMLCMDSEWSTTYITYIDYLDTLSKKDKHKELTKKRKNTFLMFHSGTTIMSGMIPIYMRDVYNEFICIMRDAKDIIEEKIIEDD